MNGPVTGRRSASTPTRTQGEQISVVAGSRGELGRAWLVGLALSLVVAFAVAPQVGGASVRVSTEADATESTVAAGEAVARGAVRERDTASREGHPLAHANGH